MNKSTTITNSVKVRTDINGINPHDFLDFKLKYEKYINFIYIICRCYILKAHFFSIFSIEKTQLRTECENMLKENWLGFFKLGRLSFYYLKRKALCCLLGRGNLSDSKFPTTRQIIRSMMLCELHLKYYINSFNWFGNRESPFLERDVYLQNRVEHTYTIALLDITFRSDSELNNIFISCIKELQSASPKKAITGYKFVFYTFSETRAEDLRKRLAKNTFSQLQDDGSEDYLLARRSLKPVLETGFKIQVVSLDINRFFCGHTIIM